MSKMVLDARSPCSFANLLPYLVMHEVLEELSAVCSAEHGTAQQPAGSALAFYSCMQVV